VIESKEPVDGGLFAVQVDGHVVWADAWVDSGMEPTMGIVPASVNARAASGPDHLDLGAST
jgi:hypothetical protein